MDFSQPVVSRPRPPRSKSGRLGSSQSSSRGVKGSQTTLDAFCPPEDLAQATTSTSARLNAAHFASISVFETLTPPATPPMANEPSMELLDNVGKVDSAVSHAFGSSKSDRSDPVPQSQIQRESSREHARSPEELEQMLAEARRIIEERETGGYNINRIFMSCILTPVSRCFSTSIVLPITCLSTLRTWNSGIDWQIALGQQHRSASKTRCPTTARSTSYALEPSSPSHQQSIARVLPDQHQRQRTCQPVYHSPLSESTYPEGLRRAWRVC